MNLKAAALRLTGLGWYVAACIVTGVVGGIFLDKLSGLAPLFTLLGVLLGTVAAFYGLYKMVQPLMGGNSSNQGTGNETTGDQKPNSQEPGSLEPSSQEPGSLEHRDNGGNP